MFGGKEAFDAAWSAFFWTIGGTMAFLFGLGVFVGYLIWS